MVEFALFRLADGTFVHRQAVLPRKNTSCHVVYGFREQDVQESVFAMLQYNISNLKKCVVTYTLGWHVTIVKVNKILALSSAL